MIVGWSTLRRPGYVMIQSVTMQYRRCYATQRCNFSGELLPEVMRQRNYH